MICILRPNMVTRLEQHEFGISPRPSEIEPTSRTVRIRKVESPGSQLGRERSDIQRRLLMLNVDAS